MSGGQVGYQLATKIRSVIEQLILYMANRELRGRANIFIKSRALIIELVFTSCIIGFDYGIINPGPNLKMIILTTTICGASVFLWLWVSAGTMLAAPPILLATFLGRSLVQQVLNIKDALEFRKEFQKMYQKMVEQDKIDEILDITFEDGSMFDSNFQDDVKEAQDMLKHPPEFKNVDNPDEFIKYIIKNQLGLEEEPVQSEIKKIV